MTNGPASRQELDARKQVAALSSIFASVAIMLGKLLAGVLSGSLALMSEAGHAMIDTFATMMTWFAVRASSQPADDQHQYGHGKFEALAALIETALLFALAVFIVVEATHRMISGHTDVETTPLAIFVLIVSIAIDGFRWRALKKIAAETKSEALAADALHFSSDLVGSTLVLAALGANAMGFRQADNLASYLVAAFIGIAGYKLARRTIDSLLDAAPEGVADALRQRVSALAGVVAIDFLRVRPAGHQIYGEIGVVVARSLSLEQVAQIKENVSAAILECEPDSVVTIAVRPLAVNDETVMERALLAAGRLRLAVHHITIQRVGEHLSVSLDIEIDGKMTLSDAHNAASCLESAIRDEIGENVEVDTHIEPQETQELDGEDLAAPEVAAIEAELTGLAEQSDLVRQIHNVRARKTCEGIIVNYHCRLPPDISVLAAHQAVDAIDRTMLRRRSNLIRIVGHAEPLTT